jgi:hypothetical protein
VERNAGGRRIRVFITHCWSDPRDEYARLRALIPGMSSPGIELTSNPSTDGDPTDPYDEAFDLSPELERQIRAAHCVLVPLGAFQPDDRWLFIALGKAIALERPVIAVRPSTADSGSAALEEISRVMRESWHVAVVPWSPSEILAALRGHASECQVRELSGADLELFVRLHSRRAPGAA